MRWSEIALDPVPGAKPGVEPGVKPGVKTIRRRLPYEQPHPALCFYQCLPERLKRLERVLWTARGGNQPLLGVSCVPSPCHASADSLYIIPHSVLAPSLTTLLEWASLRDPHALLDSLLPSLSCAVLCHVPCGPFQGRGTMWNLSMNGWSLSGEFPMHTRADIR